MNEAKKLVFEEIVNEVNFLEARCKDAFEIIYSKLERLRDLECEGVEVAKQDQSKGEKDGR